jgi:hypothetical protein
MISFTDFLYSSSKLLHRFDNASSGLEESYRNNRKKVTVIKELVLAGGPRRPYLASTFAIPA